MGNQLKDQWVKLGECRKPHGIKGGFSPFLYAKEESQLRPGSQVLLKPLTKESSLLPQGQEFHVKSITHGNKIILYLKEIENRNLCEEILPFEIFLSREDFLPVEEGEYYLSDLEGLPVRDYESKEEIGQVKGHLDNGAQIILEIKMRGKGNILVPFLDQFVPIVEKGGEGRPLHLEIILPEEV